MEFDTNIYLDLLTVKKIDELNKYIIDTMPRIFYKFYSLDENIELNDKKIKTILSSQIWFSKYQFMNDPFELNNLNINIDEIADIGDLDIETALCVYQDFLDGLKSNILFSSFSTSMLENISMWAYYTNNHKGFCCEYEFIEEVDCFSYDIRPIIYENKPKKLQVEEVQKMIAYFLEYYAYKMGNIDLSEDYKTNAIKYDKFITAICSFKDKSWSNEKEYRIYYRTGERKNNGENVELSKLNLRLKNIYCGVNCSNEHKMILKQIALILGVGFKEVIPAKKEYRMLVK